MNDRENARLCRDIATHWQSALNERDRFFSEINSLKDQERNLNIRSSAVQSKILELEFASKIPNRLGSGAVGLGLSVLDALATSRRVGQLKAEEREISSDLSQVHSKIEILKSNRANLDPSIGKLSSQYNDLNCELYAARPF